MTISVAMAAYNGEMYLPEQLDSIISQLQPEDEIVISDDGSKDGTLEIVRRYQEAFPNIRLLKGPGQGVGKNFEHAILHCSGDVICLSDQDDIWREGKLDAVRKAYADDPSVSVVLHNGSHFGSSEGRLISQYRPGLLHNILFSSYWGCCMAVRRTDIWQFLPVHTRIIAHDQLIGAVSEKYGKTKYLDQDLILHRVHGSNQTYRRAIGERIRFRMELYREYKACIRHRHPLGTDWTQKYRRKDTEMTKTGAKPILYLCVVLYNNTINNIRSFAEFQRLSREHGAVLVVCDNSVKEEILAQNATFAKAHPDIIYLDNGGNIGLPKNYNRVLGEIAGSDDWVMLSDDDTYFSDAYLEQVIRYVEAGQTDQAGLVTGVIRSQDGSLFSPKYGNHVFGDTFIEEPGKYPNIYAVNSGLVISRQTFLKTCGFDENLFLDMVDHDFMEELTKQGLNEIQVVPGEIRQAFSGNTGGRFAAMYSRFRIFRKDYLYYSKKHGASFVKTHFVLMKRFCRIILLALMNGRNKG